MTETLRENIWKPNIPCYGLLTVEIKITVWGFENINNNNNDDTSHCCFYTAAPSTTAIATTTISYLKKAGEMTTEPKYRSRI